MGGNRYNDESSAHLSSVKRAPHKAPASVAFAVSMAVIWRVKQKFSRRFSLDHQKSLRDRLPRRADLDRGDLLPLSLW
jgi:hypothetical protein